VHLTHLVIAGASYTALNPDRAVKQAQEVAATASCRTVDAAITAYVAIHDEPPTRIADLVGYVKGDIAAYRIVDGVAAGPGC
jgi:hypothetical protein